MNQLLKAALASAAGLLVIGCAGNKGSSAGAMGSVMDVSPTAPMASANSYQPVTTNAQPVIYDTAPAMPMTASSANTSAPSSGAAGGKYTVKKGDTLYAIAKKNYGDGKQWQKIASANPGLSPSTLKVGQTINVP